MKRHALMLAVLLAAPPALRAQTAEQKQATIAYLQGLQLADGGFGPQATATSKSSLRATSSGLRALKYFGGDARDRPAAAAFVGRCFDKATGGFADQPGGKPDVLVTAVGLMAVVELKMPAEPYTSAGVKYLADNAKGFEDVRIAAAGLEAVRQRPAAADAWLKEVAKTRRDDGSYGDGGPRDTGGAAVVVLRLSGELTHRDAVLKTVRAGQQPDGGFAKTGSKTSDMETTYRVMRCFMMTKERPADVAGLREYVAGCRNGDGGYGAAPGQPSSVSGAYFAGIVLYWLDKD